MFIHDLSSCYVDIVKLIMENISLDFMGFHCTIRDMAIMMDMADPKPMWPFFTSGLLD